MSTLEVWGCDRSLPLSRCDVVGGAGLLKNVFGSPNNLLSKHYFWKVEEMLYRNNIMKHFVAEWDLRGAQNPNKNESLQSQWNLSV